MTDKSTAPAAADDRPQKPLTIAVAGNPNCGKSALFNALTGIRQTTGNWPGVTVERKEGAMELDGRRIRVIDLPGIYSLDANSLDEVVTRDYLLSRDANLIVNVIDASNLERHLYLTVQLLEMGVPIVIALNMMDIARKRGIQIDTGQLAETLGCPVVPLVAVSKEGLTELQARLLAVAEGRERAGVPLAQGECVEEAVADLAPALGDISDQANTRWLALKLLESDPIAEKAASPEVMVLVEQARRQVAERAGEETDLHIADTRYGHAHTLAQRVLRESRRVERTLSDRIDQIVLSRTFGIPLFLLMIYLMFMFTMNIGGAFIDFFDLIGQALFVDGLGALLERFDAPGWLSLVLADGIGGGLQVVGTFIPIIASLYIVLSALEDSGYMARAAFVMDRFMRSIGLPGKAFVPLIVGFGCNVPAVMATRTLESERERKLTILMNPFMSCGARLPVYALFAAAFFPHSGQNLVFALYLTGIAVAILSGLVMKHTLLQGDSSGMLMELPPYHLPTIKGVLLRTWDRVKLFLREAGKVIVLMVLVLNVLSTVGSDGSLGNEESDSSILAGISRTATPLFAPMGIREDNWPAILGVFSGVLAKEVIVGTLDSLYGRLAAEESPASEPEPFDFWRDIGRAGASITDNLSELGARALDPLGLNVGEISDQNAAADEQGVQSGTFGAMAERFDGQAGAFAYLLFVLLYFPCVATIGAIVREAGAPWAMFVGFWTTTIAFLTATLFYQAAIFERDPLSAGLWIAGCVGLFTSILVALRLWASKEPPQPLEKSRA
ncbi:Fe(2+) transporter permease subunit FeoB [Thiorhodococcus mannitoliphagus]|uniref:Ferrous iron transport protein B n=1 Tax=Thiorhodococcus mannitoliphagus TaxID=329406 RepID=A0A6P1DT34_9GAMM|nr:Fe(2+) transporter permease subunit FeoB [Thiorhodococcus mannitoliphagus]NEX19182.1 Fe(2+) transporter permease subunit FeoB [Thiorhodococcus mannitoliphagus]